ncbi:hypothetical protein [Bacillus swezeyi]|nr:hypothetical protein [Bacillus swezeyi]
MNRRSSSLIDFEWSMITDRYKSFSMSMIDTPFLLLIENKSGFVYNPIIK